MSGGGLDDGHELGDLVDAMEGTGHELLRQRDRLVNLERALDSGLVLVGADGLVRLANARAGEMLELGDRDWSEMTQVTDEVIQAVGSADGSCELEWAGRPLRVTLTSCEEREDGKWRLLELRDSRSLENVQTALMVAARVRNLTRLYVGLTHDLKAPLNAITLHLKLLQRALERGSESEDGDAITPVERVDIVESELLRLQRSLELLLGQAVPAEAERQPFDLRDALSELGDLLKGPARLDGKQVEVDPGDREAMVDLKRDHVVQALLNVALNGLEAMIEGGLLRLRLARAGDRVMVEISDSGPGVDPDMQDRLFDIYESSKDSGVGAGLYIARSILESEGGGIELTSTSADGTTFTIELPAVRSRAPRSRRGAPGR